MKTELLKKPFAFILSGCLTLGTNLTCLAQAGSLDLTFSSDGKDTTDFGNQTDQCYSIAIQNDDKIVVAGWSWNSVDRDFALVRYNSDGSLDNTFDADGKVTTDFGAGTDLGYSVALQSDGKIVAAGFSYNGSDFDFALVRYNSDGSLDNTFGSIGKVTTDFGSYDYGYSVAIQADDKIVVAGYSLYLSTNVFALARYNSDGSLDNTFDSDGKVTTNVGGVDDQGGSVAIQSDGKIVVAGLSWNGTNDDFALVRYNSDGSVDSTFDLDGKVTTDFVGYYDGGTSVVIQSDGKILVSGSSDDNVAGYNFALVRYNSNGSLDNTFDSDGKVTTDFGSANDVGCSVAIQSDSKIVVGGNGLQFYGYDFDLARYNSDGSLDSTFDSDGKVNTDFGGYDDQGFSVAIQSDGKIVMAGNSYIYYSGTFNDFAVARYDAGTAVGVPENIREEKTTAPFPNPVQMQLTINLTTPANEVIIRVYDLQGRMITLPITFSNTQAQLNTATLPDGFYTLQITNNKTGEIEVGKFVKQ